MKIINKLNKIYEYRKTLVSITVVYNLVSAVIKLLLILQSGIKSIALVGDAFYFIIARFEECGGLGRTSVRWAKTNFDEKCRATPDTFFDQNMGETFLTVSTVRRPRFGRTG